MADQIVRIGTRESRLALWQAERIAVLLKIFGIKTELTGIKTEGDTVLDTPLPLMGGKGVFTKALDDALLDNRVDIAVHSYKDVPTDLPDELVVGAVCERDDPRDVLVLRNGLAPSVYENAGPDFPFHIATSSNRRMAQWLHKFPNTRISDIRGNVQTRLRKLDENDWHGVIFAAAGLKRLGLENRISAWLDWMLPAPAQGALCVMCRENDAPIREILLKIHQDDVFLCTKAERDFLHELEGGCSAPIGAHAYEKNGEIWFSACLLPINGTEIIRINEQASLFDAKNLGVKAAKKARELGAERFLRIK